MQVEEIKVIYFGPEVQGNCSKVNLTTYSPLTFPHASITLPRRANSLVGDESGIAVIDGYTLYVVLR